MKVHELMEILRSCNQEADVVVSRDEQIGDYTWETSLVSVKDILPWPEPKETAGCIELLLS